jgi:hypothetical protein
MVSLRTASLGTLIRSRWFFSIVLLALPVAYWAASRILYGVSGLYLGANSFVTSPGTVAKALEHFVRNGIVDQFRQAAAAVLHPWSWPLIALLVIGFAFAWWRPRRPTGISGRKAAGGLIVGLVGTLLAMLPYALVGKYPSANGWETRHDLLVGVPLAVLLVLGVRALLPSGAKALIGVGLLSVLVVGFAAADIEDYAALQARWAEDRAVMSQLRTMSGSGNFSIYWVQDQVAGPEPFYRFYEWSAMLSEVYGGEARIGLDTRANESRFLTHSEFFIDRYDLADFDPHGCQADLVIVPGRSVPGADQIALAYTYNRLFNPGGLPAFLDGLVTVKVVPRASPEATSCHP